MDRQPSSSGVSCSYGSNPLGDFNPYLTHINEYKLGQIVSNHIKRKNPGIAIIPGFCVLLRYKKYSLALAELRSATGGFETVLLMFLS